MKHSAAPLRLPRPFHALAWPPRIGWRRGAVQGFALGVLPLVVDMPTPMVVALFGAPAAFSFLARELVVGSFRGAVLAWTAQWVEGRLVWPAVAALV